MSEDRKVSSVKVYAKTDDASVLKVNALTFQENTEPKPKETVYTPTPYQGWDYDANEWSYESPDYDVDSVPVLTATPTGLAWAGGGGLCMQISIMGVVADGGQQGPPILVPRACRVIEVKQYCRVGTCTITVYRGPVPCIAGNSLVKNQVLSATVTDASDDCEDAIVQVRCI